MSFIQENKIALSIGLKKEYKIIHFSDVHVITYRESDSQEVIDKAKKQEEAWFKVRKDFANHFTEHCDVEQMIPSTKCLDNLIDYANEQNPNVVLLTGDIIDYYSTSNYKYLKDSLAKLTKPYLFSCGNHETPSMLYNDICDGNGEFHYKEFDEFIIVSIDDSKKTIKERQLNALQEVLKRNKPILLTMHIPLLTKNNAQEMKQYDSYYVINYANTDEVTLNFLNLVVTSPLIKAVFCGHTHGASMTYIAKDKPQYCSSSGLIGYVNNITIK